MKPIPRIFSFLLIATLFVSGQEEANMATTETASPPLSARILGVVPDGTPPPPQPPKPKYQVASRDILATTTHQEGGRTITIQEIKPIDLAPPPAPMVPAAGELSPEYKQRVEEYREAHPKSGLLLVGATVFRFKDSPPRTLVRFWPEGSGHPITFWSSADFGIIAGGINSFVDSVGDTHHMLMGWGNVDFDSISELDATVSGEYEAPAPPDFTGGKASFHVTGEQPAVEKLVPIQSLHNLYNSEYAKLKTAREGRERARIEHEEHLKKFPPQPKDIILNYWSTEKPAPTPVEGGTK